jgi:hypothetical protein
MPRNTPNQSLVGNRWPPDVLLRTIKTPSLQSTIASLRQTRHFLLAAVTCIILPGNLAAQKDSGADLIRCYQRETSEIAKRDLALKMIDAGVLKLRVSTIEDVARIFGSDWQVADESYGVVYFAKQPTGSNDEQVPFVGWYLVIHYDAKSQVIHAWELSNVHK